MLDHLFLSYGSITDVDIEQNCENMRKAWYPQKPVETLFEQIQDCVDFTEAGGVTIGAAQKLSSAPRYSSQGNLTVRVADGMRKLKQTKPGTISKFILQLHIISTIKYKEKLWEHNDCTIPGK
jgi:hypothetical protein